LAEQTVAARLNAEQHVCVMGKLGLFGALTVLETRHD
jgi:hypothetical protein